MQSEIAMRARPVDRCAIFFGHIDERDIDNQQCTRLIRARLGRHSIGVYLLRLRTDERGVGSIAGQGSSGPENSSADRDSSLVEDNLWKKKRVKRGRAYT